ncbi:hypothetical protein ACOMHN_029813 [Nucella lapillus]
MLLFVLMYAAALQLSQPVTGFRLDFGASKQIWHLQPYHLYLRQNSSLEALADVVTEPVVLWGEDVAWGNETEHCHKVMIELADQGGNFTHCLISHTQPFRLCENCVVSYTRFKNLYKALLADSVCRRVLLMSDRTQALSKTYRVLHSAWKNAVCERCFDFVKENMTTRDVTFNFTESTLYFKEMESQVSECFSNYSHQIDPANNRSKACHVCKSLYEQINGNFTILSKRLKEKICMDVVDMMNSTWLKWSGDLKCPRPRISSTVVITITCVVVTLTTLLYLVSKCVARIRVPMIAKSKRMKSCRKRRRYGALSSSENSSRYASGHIQVVESLHDHQSEEMD